jgi:hypothetical protein
MNLRAQYFTDLYTSVNNDINYTDALGEDFTYGWLRIYTGPRPAGPNVAITTQTLLAEIPTGDFGQRYIASNQLHLMADTNVDTSANATGFAQWARLVSFDGDPIADFSYGPAGEITGPAFITQGRQMSMGDVNLALQTTIPRFY